MPFGFIQDALVQREQGGLLRGVKTVTQQQQGLIQIDDKYLINFAGNDYLGLSQDQDVLQSYTEGLAAFGASSTASPVVCGYHHQHRALESRLAELTQQSSAMLFSSGFAANQAICQALAKPFPNSRHSLGVVSDKLMHASFVEAAMSYAQGYYRFAHNQPNNAQKFIDNNQHEHYLIASEGVFSMDGDCAPVSGLLALKARKNEICVMLDQAHAIGVIGKEGCGLEDPQQYDDIDIVMGTFGKSLGTQGAFVAGSSDLILYLQNFARHYVYSTALCPAIAKATDTALTKMMTGAFRASLHENIETFRRLSVANDIEVSESYSAIQPIILSGSTSVIKASEFLSDLGVLVGAIRTPTVPKNAERLRITLSASHSKKDIESLIDALCILRDKMKLEYGFRERCI